MNHIDLLEQAKALTGSTDINVLIESATKLQAYINGFKDQTDVANIFEFVERCRIKHPSKGPVTLDIYDFQKMYLQVADSSSFFVVNTARQMGLSVMNAWYALWMCKTNPDYHIVFWSPKYAMACDIISRINFAIYNSEILLPNVVESTSTTISFANNAKITATTDPKKFLDPTTNRVTGVSMMIVDQPAYLPYKDDYTNTRLLNGMYQDGIKVILAGTPNKRSGLFYDYWNASDLYIKKMEIPYYFHPERDEEWFNGMFRISGSSAHIRRDYLCQFED